MVNAHRIGRLSMLAVGIGVGAAVAATPGIAAADPLDLATAGQTVADALVGTAGATPDVSAFDPNNYAFSIDGISFHVGDATASSGLGGIAFADGVGSSANAAGFLDIATAEGVGSTAITTGAIDLAGAVGNDSHAAALLGPVDEAFANGADATAEAGGGTAAAPGYVDAAFAHGADSSALAGFFGADPTGGSVDLASASDGFTALANSGPFDVVIEPVSAAAGADVFGEALTALLSGSAGWTDLLSLF